MSLTQMLSSPYFKELKDKLKQDFPRPKISLQGELLAPAKTVNYGVVGTAFDYLFRFRMEWLSKDKAICRDGWVADSAMQSIKSQLVEKSKKRKEVQFDEKISKKEKGELALLLRAIEKERAKRSREFNKQLKAFYENSVHQYEEAKANHKSYLTTGIMTDELVKSSIVLAKLDLYARAGYLDNSIQTTQEEDIEDLQKLVSIIPNEIFTPKNICFLNPVFAEGSALFGGADADLIVDDTLIDIKTTKHLAVERVHLNQLLCYYIASTIGGVNSGQHSCTIKNIGIYFSRHGILWTAPLWKFGNDFQFRRFTGWLIKYLDEV
ncbi:MAG: hypothetical protein IPN76_32220 [Saprospiraceae bacterium]|nr:hypothetical protein [Saprospiraceae bacterium]